MKNFQADSELKISLRGGKRSLVSESEEFFDLILTDAGDDKGGMMRVIREYTAFSLSQCRNIIDNTPSLVLGGTFKDVPRRVPWHYVSKAARAIVEAGGTVKIKEHESTTIVPFDHHRTVAPMLHT